MIKARMDSKWKPKISGKLPVESRGKVNPRRGNDLSITGWWSAARPRIPSFRRSDLLERFRFGLDPGEKI